MSIDLSFKPYLMKIVKVTEETPDVRTLRLVFENGGDAAAFSFQAGQFGEYSVFGEGECTFCIASSPTRQGYIECTFRQVGRVTRSLSEMEVGEQIGFRGPYGNVFPVDGWSGKNLVFIAGGIALPPLRALIWNVLDWRDRFRDISIYYGARTVSDLVYKYELEEWGRMPGIRLITTVDPGGETSDWKGEIGFVPAVVEKKAPASTNAVAIVCGPPVMIKFTFPVLIQLGFQPENIFTTLENRMKCGVGKCGRCNVGKYYVCKDGPVFTFAQIRTLPPEY